MIPVIALLVASVSGAEEKAAALPIVQYASPYGYGAPYLGAGPLAYPVASAAPVSYAGAYGAYAPAAYAAVAPVPVAPLAHQHHAQDEFGNLAYGYVDHNSAKHESGNGAIGVTGSYQYVDPDGKLQTVQYVADALGFRVADSRLPVAPVYDGVAPEAPVYDGVAPAPVEDTPEVVAAREAHLAAFEEIAASRAKRETDPAAVYGYNTPYLLHSRFQPWNYNGIYAYNRLSYMRHHPRFAYGYYY